LPGVLTADRSGCYAFLTLVLRHDVTDAELLAMNAELAVGNENLARADLA
jgi:hypothetical protein